MSSLVIGGLGVVLLLIALFARVPIAVALSVTGMLLCVVCISSALALGGGGAQGLDTALRFARCALQRRRHAIFILELPAAGEHDVFIDALKVTPSVKRVLRRRPGYALTVYEFAPT